MAKVSGNTRTIHPTSGTRTQNYQVYKNEIAMSDVDASQSYFSKKSGGYVIAMNEDKRKQRSPEELEVAHAMANAGYAVILTPDGGVKFRSGKSKKGDYVYCDGLINGYSYEQKTPAPQSSTERNLLNSVDNAIQHARDKNAQMPLIYDRYGRFHKEHIEAGLKQFEDNSSYRFKAILVVDQYGNIYEHQHNK